jgi:hypothetical protein
MFLTLILGPVCMVDGSHRALLPGEQEAETHTCGSKTKRVTEPTRHGGRARCPVCMPCVHCGCRCTQQQTLHLFCGGPRWWPIHTCTRRSILWAHTSRKVIPNNVVPSKTARFHLPGGSSTPCFAMALAIRMGAWGPVTPPGLAHSSCHVRQRSKSSTPGLQKDGRLKCIRCMNPTCCSAQTWQLEVHGCHV